MDISAPSKDYAFNMKTRWWIVSFCCILLGVSSCVIGTMHEQGTAAPPSKKARIHSCTMRTRRVKGSATKVIRFFCSVALGGLPNLIVILDDASSEIYYARLVEDEATRSVMAACGTWWKRKVGSRRSTAIERGISFKHRKPVALWIRGS